jgi:GDPmannose 4,6-dehydratase
MVKNALITGITGQDGSYLAEFLLNKGYEVYGIIRRSSSFNTERIDHLFKDIQIQKNNHLHLIYGDMSDASSISSIIQKISPDEVYNLAAQSQVRVSFDIPEYTADIVAIGTLRVLESIRRFCPKAKFYQASSSEMYGKVTESPQKEETKFYPRSPYGYSKVFAYWTTINYRESYGIFACNGILFNHESPRRGKTFVTKKIADGLAKIKTGKKDCIYLGNLEAKRDWGHARDYVAAMWMMLQQETPEDYVISTGETHSVREFLEEALKHTGIKAKSNGKRGIKEEYIDEETGRVIVKIDKRYYRPAEVDSLLGDPSKAKRNLSWEPRAKFKDLVKEMVDESMKDATGIDQND